MTTVLVVDDDYTMRAFLKRGLSRRGLAVLDAPNIEAGLHLLHDADIVLCDLLIGSESGIRFVLQARELRPDVPIVLMSGMADNHRMQEGKRAGASATLRKPFAIDDALCVLTSTLDEEENG